MNTAKPVGSQPFFYGRITRDEAEKILRDKGCQDGLFLLRESTKKMGDYVLSLCASNNIHHYSMESQFDGRVMIENGKKFSGPVELIDYHRTHRDGLLTYPTVSCNRAPGESFVVFRGLSSVDLEHILSEKAKELGLKFTKAELLTNPVRQQLINEVKSTLHQNQPWFHGSISREEAEKVFGRSGHEDGKYLLRYQRDKGEYRLTLSYRGEPKHYIVSYKNKKYFIENGPTFDSLIEMVDHYHNKADGLLCPLKVPCIRPGYSGGRFEGSLAASSVAHMRPAVPANRPTAVRSSITPVAKIDSSSAMNRPMTTTPSRQGGTFTPFTRETNGYNPPIIPSRTGDRFSQLSNSLANSVWDEPEVPHIPIPYPRASNVQLDVCDETQKIYDSVPTTEASFNLPLSDLELQDKLGAGCFGSVIKGIYKRHGQEIPVAIKTLKLDDEAGKDEIMKEARIMAALKHRNVVRLIGVCHADTIMLVLELAPLGPLNKFLKDDPNLPMHKIINIMFQVALGMSYLESQKFVHRDLAARNVLLVNERFAKISDFGMSKALGMDGEYYKASTAGKWPLKWYAPECIYYFKFDSKSDVWSYGVTLWEATSRGGKPYQKLKGAEIIRMIDEGNRLEKPQECPPEIYKVMLQCWEYDKEDRPSFSQLVGIMKRFIR